VFASGEGESSGPHLALALSNLDLIAIGLAGAWPTVPQWLSEALAAQVRADPHGLLSLCRETHQVGLLESALRRTSSWDSLDPAVQRRILAHNLATDILAEAIRQAAAEVAELCAGLGITPVLLKGLVTRELYEHGWQREFHDLDFVVSEREAVLLYEALLRLGYTPGIYRPAAQAIVPRSPAPASPRKDGYELPRLARMSTVECDEELRAILAHAEGTMIRTRGDSVEAGISIEVHYALEAARRLAMSSAAIDLPGVPAARTLAPTEQLTYLCYKAYTGLVVFRSRRSAKLVADALRVIESFNADIDWGRIVPDAHERGVCAPVRHMLHHAVRTFGLTVEGAAGCPCTEGETKTPFNLGDFLIAMKAGDASFDLSV
jgi:hypothetical protein